MLRFILVVIAILTLGNIGVAQTPPPAFLLEPVFKEAVDYSSVPLIDGCREEPVRAVKYHACRDSRAIYEKALAKAKSEGRSLMMIFGFNRCPYCVLLERTIFNPANPMRGGHVVRYFSEAELGRFMVEQSAFTLPYVRIHARSEHGLKLADDLGVTAMAKKAGWHRVWSPFVVFVNPVTGEMSSESEWEAKEVYCDWPANIAVSLEKIGMAEPGKPVVERRRCPKA